MRRNLTTALPVLAILVSARLFAQEPSTCELAYQLVKTVEKFHYTPKTVNDQFSEQVFKEFISLIDPASVFFSASDIAELATFKHNIDDEILNKDCKFIEKATTLYEQRLNDASLLIDGLQGLNLDFEKTDSLVIFKEEKPAKTTDLPLQWERLAKFQMLSTYVGRADSLANLPPPTVKQVDTLKLRAVARNKCRISSRLNYPGGVKAYIGDKFLKAVAFAFDPHTMYFGMPEKNEFESGLAKESKGYGFEFEDNETGEMEIYTIIPGSPAWNSNALNEGDIIEGVETIGGKVMDFTCIGMEEAYRFLNDKSINEAYFDIKKKNGKSIRIKLYKDKIDVEENVIRSFVLEGEKKIGYIYLPSFYTDMSGSYFDLPNGCANDLAKEVIKLKREGIDGLIFDLRDNGGGSMLEAIRVAGIFINFGAVAIVAYRDGETETIKDMDRGTIFDKPLLILINKFSASASELFAAAMQDYNRAVIAGSASFGKSTAQDIIPIDAYRFYSPDTYAGNVHAFVKLTEGAFFRVTGETHQKEGVQPDLRLPDVYDMPEMGEAQFSSSLELPKIDKKTYYYPLSPLPTEMLREKSDERIMASKSFTAISTAKELKREKDFLFNIPLEFSAFKSFVGTLIGIDEEIDSEEKSVFFVKSPSYLEGTNAMTSNKKEINENVMNSIKKDIYVIESFHILNDLIQSKSN